MQITNLARNLAGFASRLFFSNRSLEVALACSRVSTGLREQLVKLGVCDEPVDPLCKKNQSEDTSARILSELRKFRAAIALAQSVIKDFTQLVESNPDKYMDYLLCSYNMLCNRILDIERFQLQSEFNADEREQLESLALSTAQKLFELYQALMSINPVLYKPSWAMANNVLAQHIALLMQQFIML